MRWLSIILLFASVAAWADTERDSIAHEEMLEQMVVTATRTPRLLKNTPVLTRVLTSDDIRQADVADITGLLQQELPGIEFSWAMSKETSLNMGGFGGNSVLFLVDGERLAGETMNNPDFSRLSLDNVERIEIVRGAASSLYGSSAVGGVINIITKKVRRPVQLNVNAHAGRHEDYRAGATLGTRFGKFANTLSARYTHTGEYEMNPFSGAINQRLVSNENHTWQCDYRLSWTPCRDFTLTARAGYFFRERGYDASENNRYRDFSGGMRGEYRFGDNHAIELAYTFDQYDKSDYSLVTMYDIRDYSNVQNSLRTLYTGHLGRGWTLTAGGDVMRDYLQSYMFSGGRSQTTADIFAQADWEVNKRWELVGGLRYDHYSKSSSASMTAKLSARYKVTDGMTLRASYSGGFRAPTLKEMYMDFDMAGIFMIYGNRTLKPERSHNLQLSAEYGGKTWHATVSVSHSFVDNRITTLWDKHAVGLYGNMGAMRYQNIADMGVTGIEANVAKHFGRHWDARLCYCYNHVQVPHTQLYTDDTRPHSTTAKVGYRLTFGREVLSNSTGTLKSHILSVSLSARYLSPLSVRELNASYTAMNSYKTHYDGYLVARLTAQLHTPWGFTLTATADNLFDYTPSVYTYYSPKTTGTAWSVGLSYDL